MYRYLSLMAFIGALIIGFTPVVNAGSNAGMFEPRLFDKLPVKYVGTFQWLNGHQIQKVEFNFGTQKLNKEGYFLLSGKGLYVTVGKKTNIAIMSLVNPKTHEIQIWELLPDSDNFVTNGSHIGNISSDLMDIEAIWKTKGTGEQGVLKLRMDR